MGRCAMLSGMNPKRVTMADLAARLRISKSAVSMALRNHSSISLKRREQVRRVAEEMGFVPDPFLSGLAAFCRTQARAGGQGALAWVNHWAEPEQLRGQFKEFAAYWRGAEAAARQHGYRLDEVRWEKSCPPKRLERILLARGIGGVLVPPHNELLDWGDFDWTKFAIIRFGRSVQNPDSNLVSADHLRAVVMAVERIREYGYQRIGMILGREFNERLGGNYASGFLYAQHLLQVKPVLPLLSLEYGARSPAERARVTGSLRQWLTRHKPDAVLTTEIEVPGMIRALGYRIPQDVAVAGTSVLDIPVEAGVDQHSEAVGRIAAETLIKQLNVNELGEPFSPCRILVESRWQDGASLPPKSGPSRVLGPAPKPEPAAQTMRVKLGDIAARLGVSKVTVSLALRNDARISARRREEVHRTAKEMGYTPDPFLAGLAAYRQRRSETKLRGVIGWMNHWQSPEQLRNYHEFEAYWQGATEAADRLGYQLEEVRWPVGMSGREIGEKLKARGVLGLLIPPHPPEEDWSDFDWSHFSLMRFGLSVRPVDSNLVAADHQRAMVMAITRIHDYGYRRIGLVFNEAHDRSMGGSYYGGFVWARGLLGISPSIPPLDCETKTLQFADQTRRNLAVWMKKFRPDAILTARAEVPLLLRDLGYDIPGDVAVASTSPYDIPVDAGIDQHPFAIGKIAAEMIIKQVTMNERGEPPDPCRILVESRWKDGRSLPRKAA